MRLTRVNAYGSTAGERRKNALRAGQARRLCRDLGVSRGIRDVDALGKGVERDVDALGEDTAWRVNGLGKDAERVADALGQSPERVAHALGESFTRGGLVRGELLQVGSGVVQLVFHCRFFQKAQSTLTAFFIANLEKTALIRNSAACAACNVPQIKLYTKLVRIQCCYVARD